MFGLKETIVLLGCLTVALSAPSLRVRRDDSAALDAIELNPITSEDSYGDGLDREKRKLPEAKFAAKNAVLGFVFGASKGSAGLSSGGGPAALLRGPATQVPVIAVTDDTPDFDRTRVALDLPDQLFSTSFTTITNVSKLFGDLILNSARRYSDFVQIFKPLLGKALIVKGITPPPPTPPTTTTTSTTARTTDSLNSSDNNNEV